ncbi:hypothetical protein [Novosphingobium sp. PP1Y]|uniref:hypothetical protein n=1 Tax=Novosphingobium sp. PP1Y TaxID=702113 RepID=UPI0002FF0889|nr:hypothetical protein [Novosphingobium sp. PP1Y]
MIICLTPASPEPDLFTAPDHAAALSVQIEQLRDQHLAALGDPFLTRTLAVGGRAENSFGALSGLLDRQCAEAPKV